MIEFYKFLYSFYLLILILRYFYHLMVAFKSNQPKNKDYIHQFDINLNILNYIPNLELQYLGQNILNNP